MVESIDGSERILRAAIEQFGHRGVQGTSLKAIAQEAGVSPALILHHYGSKDGLRVACDERVAQIVRTAKSDTVAGGPHLDPMALLAAHAESHPVLRYLARTLTDGSSHVNDLIDEMVEDALRYTAEAERAGFIRASADPRARIVVLLLWSLGALVLHDHLKRLLDVDLVDGTAGSPLPYFRAVLEIYTEGVLTHGAYQEVREMTDVPPNAAGTEKEIP